MAYPKFVINKSSNDEHYFFNLHAVNTKIIATSEMYTTKQACRNGIEAAKINALIADIEDQT